MFNYKFRKTFKIFSLAAISFAVQDISFFKQLKWPPFWNGLSAFFTKELDRDFARKIQSAKFLLNRLKPLVTHSHANIFSSSVSKRTSLASLAHPIVHTSSKKSSQWTFKRRLNVDQALFITRSNVLRRAFSAGMTQGSDQETRERQKIPASTRCVDTTARWRDGRALAYSPHSILHRTEKYMSIRADLYNKMPQWADMFSPIFI